MDTVENIQQEIYRGRESLIRLAIQLLLRPYMTFRRAGAPLLLKALRSYPGPFRAVKEL